jgi:hypothetical protein
MTWEEACSILGVPLIASDNEIKEKWLYWNRILHTDRTINLPQKDRLQAEEQLKKINAAHDFLNILQNRPNNSPPKLHISLSRIHFSCNPGQKKTTTFTVNNIGGLFSKFWMDDAPTPWLRVVAANSPTDTVLPIEVTIEATGIGYPGSHFDCTLPFRIENEKTKRYSETQLKIELSIKPLQQSTTTHNPKPKQTYTQPKTSTYTKRTTQKKTYTQTTTKKPTWTSSIPKWLVALLFVAGISVLRLILDPWVGDYISVWIILIFSCIYAIEKWLKQYLMQHMSIGRLYKSLLVFVFLFLLVTVLSSIRGFFFGWVSFVGVSLLVLHFVLFIWVWKVIMRYKSLWPNTAFSIFITIILGFLITFLQFGPFHSVQYWILSWF